MASAMVNPTARTLYDDWKARREQLACAEGGTAEYRAVEIRLLDYLMHRYKDSPEAARPALFPLSSSLFVDHRAIVVCHHLGRGSIPTISNRQQAYAHIQSMLEHQWTMPSSDELAASEEGIPRFLEPVTIDPVEAVRQRLCDADPTARVQAALQLGEIGALDDIGLLSDLLSLPFSLDEHPQERAALLHAMQRLSGATAEPFVLIDKPSTAETSRASEPAVSDDKSSYESMRDSRFFVLLLLLAGVFFFIGVFVFVLSCIVH
jgi:hypothetical protein